MRLASTLPYTSPLEQGSRIINQYLPSSALPPYLVRSISSFPRTLKPWDSNKDFEFGPATTYVFPPVLSAISLQCLVRSSSSIWWSVLVCIWKREFERQPTIIFFGIKSIFSRWSKSSKEFHSQIWVIALRRCWSKIGFDLVLRIESYWRIESCEGYDFAGGFVSLSRTRWNAQYKTHPVATSVILKKYLPGSVTRLPNCFDNQACWSSSFIVPTSRDQTGSFFQAKAWILTMSGISSSEASLNSNAALVLAMLVSIEDIV